MVKYFETEKGYFYKLLKDGSKKRVSSDEFHKKKNIMRGGGREAEKRIK